MCARAAQTTADVDYLALLDQAIAGDRLAYGRVIRLVAGYLTSWRAGDFRGDWDDIIQEVLLAAVKAHREGRIPSSHALRAFLRQSARFKFVDRIRARGRRPTSSFEEDTAQGVSAQHAEDGWPPGRDLEERAHEIRLSIEAGLHKLSERERVAITQVYLKGLTYHAASEGTGIPLGTLKRALRTGMATLREVLDDDAE